MLTDVGFILDSIDRSYTDSIRHLLKKEDFIEAYAGSLPVLMEGFFEDKKKIQSQIFFFGYFFFFWNFVFFGFTKLFTQIKKN